MTPPILTLGYSPCPNDTLIFHALVHGRVPFPRAFFSERLEDVETLNQLAVAGALDISKVSYHAFGHLRRDYVLLRSGGALGRGCGPLVVARTPVAMGALRGKRIAIPGRLTTANLLLQLYGSGYDNVVLLPFQYIMAAVAAGEVDAGLIIHESRFTYPDYGLHQVLDLGIWWEGETGLPLPLGGIIARRTLGPELIADLDAALGASVDHARRHPEEAAAYIKTHAQEIDETVTARHIALYVNDFSRDLGDEGLHAVETLLSRARKRRLLPPCDLPLSY